MIRRASAETVEVVHGKPSGGADFRVTTGSLRTRRRNEQKRRARRRADAELERLWLVPGKERL